MAYYNKRSRKSRRGRYGYGSGGYKTKRRGLFKKPAYTGMKINTTALAQAKSYFDPFSLATVTPKIPDGKCLLSTGLRLQAVYELAANTDSGVMHIWFYPGINAGLEAKGVVDNQGTVANGEVVVNYTGHAPLYADRAVQNTSNLGRGFNKVSQFPLTADDTLETSLSNIVKWRLVSQGLKLSLVNNSDENDGWWEAIRFTPSQDSNEWTLGSRTADETAAQFPFYVERDYYGNLKQETQTSLVEHPTYNTGKIRDLHKYMFQLKAQDTDHPFNKLAAQEINAEKCEEFIRNCVDQSYDCIYIRIHGRPTGSNPTRLLAHVVSNQEVMYESESTMNRFHTETVAIPNFDTIAGAQTNTNKQAGHVSNKRRRTGD